jgi:heme/copper-type cytochrome/quinol oxidase subunit 4
VPRPPAANASENLVSEGVMVRLTRSLSERLMMSSNRSNCISIVTFVVVAVVALLLRLSLVLMMSRRQEKVND